MTKVKPDGKGPSFFDFQAWRYFVKFYHGQFRRLAFSSIISSAQSLIIIPTLLLVRYVFDEAIPQKNIQLLVLCGVGIFTFRLANSGIALWIRSINLNIIRTAVFRLREDILKTVCSFSRSTYTAFDQKTVHARIVQDTERLSHMSDACVSRLLPSLFGSLVLSVILLFLNWYLFLIVCSILPVLYLANRYTGKRVKERVFLFQRSFEKFSKGILFVLRFMDLTKIQTNEDEELRRQRKILEKLSDRTGVMGFIFAVHGSVQSNLTGLTGVIILVLGGYSVAVQSITLGEFISFYVAMGQLNSRVSTITSSIADIIAGNESMATLSHMVGTRDTQPYHGRKHIPFTGCIAFQSVSFRYDDSPLLEEVTLNLYVHETIAIIGANGSGKSTVIQLILGFYRPREGKLYADSIPYDDLDMVQLRRHMGVVMQSPSLFSGTILENLTYGLPRYERKQVIHAAQIAMADEFVNKLPKGYETEIGEDGIRLSGGERQRLAIARALLRRPKLLILDEPTNHLDRAAVSELMGNLENLEERPAILMISHDESVVGHADEVYQLENGILIPLGAAQAVPKPGS